MQEKALTSSSLQGGPKKEAATEWNHE